MMKQSIIISGIFLLLLLLIIPPVSADPIWTSSNGCWTNISAGGNVLVMWNATGNSTWFIPANVSSIEVLIIGGGGSSGGGVASAYAAGAGGAGGWLNGSLTGITVGENANITVGAGGAAVASGTLGNNGTSSLFNTYIAYGGGGGGAGKSSATAETYGMPGGSSGGSAKTGATSYPSTQTSQGTLTGYGYKGGDGDNKGGGGAGGTTSSSAGGAGRESLLTGVSVIYAKGGNAGGSIAGTLNGFGHGGNLTSGGVTSNAGGSGVIIVNYSTTPISPTARFTLNATVGITSIPIQFNDTSLYIPTSWNWSFKNITGNNTEVWFSQSQNPSYVFDIGHWLITLNATNAVGTNISTQVTFINVSKNCSDGGGYSQWYNSGDSWVRTNSLCIVRMWNATGNITWTRPTNLTEIEYLLIAGGGGSSAFGGGGGGAGGYLVNNSTSINGTTINISVGDGGAGGVAGVNSGLGIAGQNSSFGSFLAYGGGTSGNDAVGNGASGRGGYGSGGGAGTWATGTGTGGTSAGQGNAGGNQGSQSNKGGGGGGAGGVGIAGNTNNRGGDGGVGIQNNITGTLTYYAGGGGGGVRQSIGLSGGAGGLGGGGIGDASASRNGTNGTPGTGGGAGGSRGYTDTTAPGYKGGSGVVIIRYDVTTNASPPISFFTSNVTNGLSPLSVQFTDTSVFSPTSWNWSFKNVNENNTQVWFSQSQNPDYIFSTGNWLITLNVTNSLGTNISTQVTFINVTPNCSLGGAYSTWAVSDSSWVKTNSLCTVRMWNATGNTTWTPTSNLTIEYLVIAGGGGSSAFGGGGGGAGGYLWGNFSSLNNNISVNISVGDGGAGGVAGVNSGLGIAGQNSSFGSFLAYGGGTSGNDAVGNGASGRGGYGSGGGAGTWATGTGTGGTSAGQGNAGGNQGGQSNKGGGGGGAGGAGVAGNINSRGGDGGVGLQNNITGTLTYYAGGGGGGVRQSAGVGGGYAGNGGGGNGSSSTSRDGTNGTPGTGGGAGGSRGYTDTTAPGYKGGSGVVIISYANIASPPTSSFASNVTNGLAPLVVQFNDTSSFSPTSWNWSFKNVTGNNTEIWFSQSQNPYYIFSIGNWSIILNVTNSVGTNISTQVTFINVTAAPEVFDATTYGNFTDFIINSTSNLTDYQVMMNLSNSTGYTSSPRLFYTNGTTRSDWVDITFTNTDNTTLGFWKESKTETSTNSTWWIKVPNIANNNTTKIRMFYGNLSKTLTYMDGDNTFIIFDHFDNSSLNTTKWTSSGGTPSTGNSNLTLPAGVTIQMKTTTGVNVSVMSVMSDNNYGFNYFPIFGWGSGANPMILTWGADPGPAMALWVRDAGSGGRTNIGSSYPLNNIFDKYEIIRNGTSSAIATISNRSTIARTTELPTGSMTVQLSASNSGTTHNVTADWIALRKYNYSEPFMTHNRSILSIASFTSNVTTGSPPLTVQFNDTSTNAPTAWNWSFQNVIGNNTEVWFSQTQNASHTFNSGNFSIKLNASGGLGYNISTQVTFINVTNPPIANFTSNITSWSESAAIQFNDTSVLNPTAWNWSFTNVTPGNNTPVYFSTLQNPIWTFTRGTYDIRLNVTNATGTSRTSTPYYINIYQNCIYNTTYRSGGATTVLTFNNTTTCGLIFPDGVTSINMLMIGGGGGGGNSSSTGEGGGGGGGFIENNSYSIVPNSLYLITVGNGGATSITGGNTSFSNTSINITALGGGGGGHTDRRNGLNGGSGGGAGEYGAIGLSLLGQGFDGGDSYVAGGYSMGGGGGGAGAVGQRGPTNIQAGNGGSGKISYITGLGVYYAGGGGGYYGAAGGSAGSGGVGGGGSGGVSGTNSLGGGGGGSGGLGGSGIIVMNFTSVDGKPIVSFTSNVSQGISPFSVQFNDTSQIDILTWNWSFTNVTPGNNTPVYFSTSQNPILSIDGGGIYDIRLNVTNASGYRISPLSYNITVLRGCSPYTSIIAGYDLIKFNDTNSTCYYIMPQNVTLIDYLVVAGGGGGGGNNGGGGGGAGGMLNNTNFSIVPFTIYNITVGAGGAVYSHGYNSTFANTTGIYADSMRGGIGGRGSVAYATSGGSGGGGGGAGGAPFNVPGSGITGQGFSGGNGGAFSGGTRYFGGGGGGAGSTGTNAGDYDPGDGGIGRNSSITGSEVTYAGGGGGDGTGDTIGYGGAGGGGNGKVAGVDELGGGGGANAKGGNGIIYIRYANSSSASKPIVSFTVTKNFIRIPNSIIVTDTSSNTPTSWDWSWGDGTANSNTQNPSHTYLKRGQWNITLTVTNAGGSNTTSTLVRVTGYE